MPFQVVSGTNRLLFQSLLGTACNGLFECDLTHGFDVTTVSDVAVASANYLYILQGILPVRPSEEKI